MFGGTRHPQGGSQEGYNFFEIAHHIEILVNFAFDSVREEAEAASPDSTFVYGGLLSAEKVC